MENKILIIDIETTDFLQRRGKIVEVGITELNLDNGERKILFDKVMHEKGVTMQEVEKSWIVANSSLTMEMVRHSKNLETYREEIQNIIYKYPLGITAFNKRFDFDFMENRGFEFPEKLACPMALSKNIVKAKNKRGALKNPNVNEVYKSLVGDGYTELHRGGDDSLNEAAIVYELYSRGVFKVNESKVTKVAEDFETEPVKTFEFERAENHNDIITFLSEIEDSSEFQLSKHEKITNVNEWAKTQITLLEATASQPQYNSAIEFITRFHDKYEIT